MIGLKKEPMRANITSLSNRPCAGAFRSRFTRHHKRESRHHVIGCNASRSQWRFAINNSTEQLARQLGYASLCSLPSISPHVGIPAALVHLDEVKISEQPAIISHTKRRDHLSEDTGLI